MHPRLAQAWRHHDGFRRNRAYGYGYGYGYGPAFDPGIGSGWGAMGSWSAPGTVASGPPAAPVPLFRPPTAADLPVAGVRTEPPGPPTLFVVNDITGGSSSRPGGARIVSASKPRIIGADGGAYGAAASAPRIIDLTAR